MNLPLQMGAVSRDSRLPSGLRKVDLSGRVLPALMCDNGATPENPVFHPYLLTGEYACCTNHLDGDPFKVKCRWHHP
jgi:hypothetical protein